MGLNMTGEEEQDNLHVRLDCNNHKFFSHKALFEIIRGDVEIPSIFS